MKKYYEQLIIVVLIAILATVVLVFLVPAAEDYIEYQERRSGGATLAYKGPSEKDIDTKYMAYFRSLERLQRVQIETTEAVNETCGDTVKLIKALMTDLKSKDLDNNSAQTRGLIALMLFGIIIVFLKYWQHNCKTKEVGQKVEFFTTCCELAFGVVVFAITSQIL